MYPTVSSGLFRCGKTTLDEEMIACEGEILQPAPLCSKLLELLVCWGFFNFYSVFFSIINVQEHTGDSPLVHTGGLFWDLLFCRKNMSLLQESVKSGGIQIHVHPETEPHSGTCSRSFPALPCAAPVSQPSHLEPEAMELLFLIL